MVQIYSILSLGLAISSVLAAPMQRYNDDQQDVDSSYDSPSYDNSYEHSQVEADVESTATTLVFQAVETVTFGSGSQNWQDEYDDCVSQCFAQYPPPSSSSSQQVEGAVHTVLVAPDGAGLRYVPFAVNASVGDTIRFKWTTSNQHTVTLGDELAICNQSANADASNFLSGIRSGDSTYDVLIKDTKPQFFFCAVSDHCDQGMWGMINPSASSSQNVASLIQSDPNLDNAYSYMSSSQSMSPSVSNWGMSIDSSSIPESMHDQLISNVLFTQAQFAANPGMMEETLPADEPVRIVQALTLLSNSVQDPAENSGAPNGTRTGAEPTITGLQVVPVSNNAAMKVGASWLMALGAMSIWLFV